MERYETKLYFAFYVIFFTVGICCQIGFCQNATGLPSISQIKSIYYFTVESGTGKLIPHEEKVSIPNDQYLTLRFLEDADVIAELDLIPEQEAGLKSKLKRIRELSQKIQNAIGRNLMDDHMPSGDCPELSMSRDLANELFEDLLVSHQVQRIDQIILRYHIRQNGFIRRFEVGGILHDLEITNDQLKCLGNIKELIATELDAAAEEIRGEVEKRILDHLNVAQREHLKQIMIDLNINKPQSLDLMAAQIDHCEQFIQMAENFQIDCCMSFLDPFFEIDLKGNLIVVRNPGEKLVVGVDEKNAEAMQDWIFFNGVVTGISQKELHSELGLSIRQVSKIEDLVDEIRMQCTMISRPPTGVFGDPDEFVKWLECMYINQTGLISEFSPTLTLLIKQFDERKFSEYRIRSEITRLGLTFSLTAGQLASVLDVSEDQKRAIRSELDEFVDYISKNTIEEEEKALNKLLECLDQNQRQQFDSLVCKQLRASRANLGVFAEQLRGPSKR